MRRPEKGSGIGAAENRNRTYSMGNSPFPLLDFALTCAWTSLPDARSQEIHYCFKDE